MKKTVFFFLVAMVIVGFAVEDSSAGQLCWQLSGFSTIIKASITDLGSGHKLVTGVRFMPNSAGSAQSIVGSFEKDPTGGTERPIGWTLTSTDGSLHCVYGASLSPTSTPKWEGPGGNSCTNGVTNTWNLLRVNCTTYEALGTTKLSTTGKSEIEP